MEWAAVLSEAMECKRAAHLDTRCWNVHRGRLLRTSNPPTLPKGQPTSSALLFLADETRLRMSGPSPELIQRPSDQRHARSRKGGLMDTRRPPGTGGLALSMTSCRLGWLKLRSVRVGGRSSIGALGGPKSGSVRTVSAGGAHLKGADIGPTLVLRATPTWDGTDINSSFSTLHLVAGRRFSLLTLQGHWGRRVR